MNLFLFALAGCGGGPDPSRAPDPPEVTVDIAFAGLPAGPADPLRLDLVRTEGSQQTRLYAVEPVVEDAAGAVVPVEPVDWEGETYAWAPAGGWAPGDYRIVGAAEVEATLALPFAVDPWGADPAVDPQDLVGRTWEVTDGWTAPQDLSDLLLATASVLARVIEVDGDALIFELIVRGDGGDCLALRDEARFDPGAGVATWTVEELGLDWDGTEIPLSDLSLRIAWRSDDLSVAWADAAGVADTRFLGRDLFPEGSDTAVCELGDSLGIPCFPCADGAAVCAGSVVHAAALIEADEAPAAELPLCGLDRTEIDVTVPDIELQPISCDIDPQIELDIDCGCRTVGVQGGLPVLLALVAVGRRRRRR